MHLLVYISTFNPGKQSLSCPEAEEKAFKRLTKEELLQVLSLAIKGGCLYQLLGELEGF